MRGYWQCFTLALLLAADSTAHESDAHRMPGAIFAPASATGTGADEAAVLRTVDRFFAANAAQDVATASAILHPQGVLVSQKYPGGTEATAGYRSNAEWLDGMTKWTRRFNEYTSNSSVAVRGPVAVVWQSYRVESDGRFSHCGVNIVSFVKFDDAWKIASIVWTVEHSGCPA